MPMWSLQCALCETGKLCQPDEEAIRSLRDRGACLLPCDICGSSTYWILSRHERRSHPGQPSGVPAAAPGVPSADSAPRTDPTKHVQRDHRAPLSLPVRLRVWTLGGLEEITTTKNVSRGGLYFETAVDFRVGQEVRVALNYSGKSAGTVLEQTGHIVRVEPLPGGPKKGVAIRYDLKP
jgi:hypothetical protein